MRTTQLTFEKLPALASNIHSLGSLCFDKRNELGPRAYIDLRDASSHPQLARDFVAALYEHSSPGTIASDLSLGPYLKLIRCFLDYCSIAKMPSTFRMKEIDFGVLLDYRAHLIKTLSSYKSERRRRRFGDLLRLIEAGQALGIAHPDVVFPRNFPHIRDGDITQPYTAGEALDFEDACRNDIRDLLARLRKGKELVALGNNPRLLKTRCYRDPANGRKIKAPDSERPWNQLPNLIWYVLNILGGRYLKHTELLATGHTSFVQSVGGGWKGEYRLKDVYGHLYPLAEDLIPFIILLAKITGRNESSILELKRDCLQVIDDKYFMHYTKLRGKFKTYKKRIINDGEFSPVSLIKILLSITEPLVPLAAPTVQNRLFLGLTVGAHETDPVKPPEASYIKYQMNHNGGWCDKHGLKDEHGDPLKVSLRKWRVYYLVCIYLKRGQMSKVSRDAAHTLSKTTIPYVNNDATKPIHEQATESGIQSALSVSRVGVLVDDDHNRAADTVGQKNTTIKRQLNREQEVLFASCKDFYNRPGGPPGMPCEKPWGCLLCSNAVITRHVLPRVIALYRFMQTEQNRLTAVEWKDKFGQTSTVIENDVLPKFRPEIIAEAEQLSKNGTYYIPLALKV